MNKKSPNLGLHSGLPPITSEEAAHEQWLRGPRVLGPSIATLLVQQSKAEQPNLGLNNGVPELGLTWREAIALVEENKRRGGRTVTRKSAGEQAMERLQAAREKPPRGTD